ncbi:MAG: hypothetical protein ABSG68_27115 [Thermoguttaceae bacterium]|jgi:hypothetical protein
MCEVALTMFDSVRSMESSRRSDEELQALLAACRACGEFRQGCTRGPCGQRWLLWRRRLASGQCEHWPT